MKKLLPIISIILFLMVLYFSDFEKTIAIISEANISFLALAGILMMLSLALRVTKWKLFLNALKLKNTWSDCAHSFLPGLFIGNITPVKIGEPIRSYILKKIRGHSVTATLPSIWLEKVLEMLSTIMIGLLGIIFVWKSQFNYVFIFFGIALFLIVLTILLAKSKRALKFFAKFIPKVTGNMVNNLRKGFKIGNKNIVIIFLLTTFIWIVDGIIFYMAFISIGIIADPLFIISLFSFAVVVSVITFLPGGIGSFELAFILILPITMSGAAAGVLLGRVFTFWIPTLIASVSWKITK